MGMGMGMGMDTEKAIRAGLANSGKLTRALPSIASDCHIFYDEAFNRFSAVVRGDNCPVTRHSDASDHGLAEDRLARILPSKTSWKRLQAIRHNQIPHDV